MRFQRRTHGLRWAPPPFAYVCAILAFAPTLFADKSDGCFLQDKTLGSTYPHGDIVLHVGEPLELFCTIDPEKAREKNYGIEDLIFVKERQPVDPRYVTRVNETTIRLYMENQTESEHMYYCYLQRNQSGDGVANSLLNSLEMTTGAAPPPNLLPEHEMVCMNWVSVGVEPRDVENYTCISLNWQVLNCSWNVPKNYVKTTYRIEYSPKHRYSEKKSCPTDDDVLHNFCTWTLRSTPLYRKNFEVLRITITGSNKFKSNEQSFYFTHFAHMLMDPPKELKLLAKNTTSMTLQWDIGDLQYFPKPIHYKVLHLHNGSDWDTTVCDAKNSAREGTHVWCVISGLICNRVYNVRVFMKSSLASDKYWSNYTSQLFKTSASLPAHPPLTDVGSFQIEDVGNTLERTVYVYWQPLKMNEQCGDNFTYNVTALEVGGDGVERAATSGARRIEAVGSYAKFEVGDARYRFEIRAVNKEGVAPGASSVVVPAAPHKVERCRSFTKTDYGQTANCSNMYEVSWQPPAVAVDNYTVFWCENDKERPYQCSGYLRWKTIAANATKDNICVNSTGANVASVHQFAISANTPNASSGMMWATCSVLHDQLGMVRQVYMRGSGPSHIEVGWKLECMDQASTVLGYKVRYCPVLKSNTSVCAPGTNYTVVHWLSNNTHRTSGNLTGLQPYTYYRVAIYMYNAEKEGQSSPPEVFRTAEGAPNVAGLKLHLMEKTNTSVIIGWETPRLMNGELQHYEVVLRQLQQAPEGKLQTVSKPQVTIQRLEPFANYSVTVRACTSVCSPEIAPLEVTTRVGKPGKVETIVLDQQDHQSLVRWDPPSQLAGPHPYYEVHMLKDNVEVFANRTNDTHMWIAKPDCSADHNAKYEVRVRAINVDDKRDAEGAQLPIVYEGDRSPAYILNCTDGVGILWKILMWTTFPVLFMVFVGYGSRKFFHKCRQMKNVHVTIPLKFTLPPMPNDSKGEEMFVSSYTQVPPLRPLDEFSTLVDKTAEQSV